MNGQHPIEALMKTTLESIKNMVDVNTIIGDPVETPDGKVIMPISRVTFGFAAGGTEFETGEAGETAKEGTAPAPGGAIEKDFPFGGGSGAGISIQPVAFLVVGREELRLLPVDGQAIYDRLIDLAPRVIDQLQEVFMKNNHRPTVRGEAEKAGTATPVIRPRRLPVEVEEES